MASADPPLRDTALAETMAVPSSPARAPASLAQPTLKSTRPSVLPRIEHADGGALRVVHEASDRYRVEAHLGQGGMGEAMKAQDVDIGRPVAIKRLLRGAESPTHTTELARFVEEVRIVGNLEHPNVVPVHDVGVDADGRYFFVMKYVEGQTLEQIIERLVAGDPAALAEYSFERRTEVFIGMLHALEYAHARGIVHRDIKPSNVMVGRFGEVWLMDWGVAKKLVDKDIPYTDEPSDTSPRAQIRTTRHGALVGTPAYMAPEQARAEHGRVDGRSDLYAACATFYELLLLRHYLAHRMQTLPALLDAIQKEELPSPRFFEPAPGHPVAPAELAHFVRKGLEKDPEARYQSAAEMIAGLHAIQEGRVRVQCVATLSKRVAREAGRFVDRRPALAFVLMMLAALLFVGAIGLLVWRLVG